MSDLSQTGYNEFRIHCIPGTTTQPISDLTQTRFKEFWILGIPDIAFLVFKTGVFFGTMRLFSNLSSSKPPFNFYKKPEVLRA